MAERRTDERAAQVRRRGRMRFARGFETPIMATTPTGTRCFDALHSHAALAERNRRSRARLAPVREALNESAIVRDNPLAIFCAGSLARMESGRKSDLDLFVTAEAGDHGELRKRLFQLTLFSELMAINQRLARIIHDGS